MGQVFVFGRDDPVRTRFAVSPLWETVGAVRVLLEPHRHTYHLPWLDEVRPELNRLDLAPLLALSPPAGWSPDFLSVVAAGPGITIADQLALVRATPLDEVAYEVRRSLTDRGGAPVPESAWRLLDDPASTRARLADLLAECWELLVAPHWPRLRDLLDSDVAFRTRTLADYGLERVLGDLHPRARWTGRTLVIAEAPAGLCRLRGAGLLLMPSVFVWPDVVSGFDPPWQPMLVYPARGIGGLWTEPADRTPDALVRLLGRGRAAVLTALDEPATTTSLAHRLALAPSSVSAHLTVLRESGLLTSRRYGHQVLYERTPLGIALSTTPQGARGTARTSPTGPHPTHNPPTRALSRDQNPPHM